MNALIKIQDGRIGVDQVQTVSARELHAFLAVGKDFSTWIKDRIDQYGFIEHRDYAVFSDPGKNPIGGRPAREYALTLDMAKELAMVERNEKGRQARQYFLECERKVKSGAITVGAVPQTLSEALRLAADLEDKRLQAEAALALAAPKVAAFSRIAEITEGAVCLRVAAKLAKVPERKFVEFLRQQGWIFRHHHGKTWMGYGSKEREGYLELKRTAVERNDGSEKVVEQVLITPRGLAKITELIERKAPQLRTFDSCPGDRPLALGDPTLRDRD